MSLAELTVGVLSLLGAGLTFIASIGVIRMPDLYTRMQSATKAGSLGVACLALAAGVHFGNTTALAESLLVVLFLFGTAPVASILIARAAYAIGTPVWVRTNRDDLRDDLRDASPRGTAPSIRDRPDAGPGDRA